MSSRDPNRPPYARRVAAGVLLGVPIAATLAVPLFDRVSPSLLGFPFFYWFQLVWVLLTGLCAGIAFRVLRPRVRATHRATPRAGPHSRRHRPGEAH